MRYVRKLVTVNTQKSGRLYRTVSIPNDFSDMFPSGTVTIQALPGQQGIMIMPVVGDELIRIGDRKYVD